ncbi:hypothetical protein DE146DRAFT_755339 [Phaeosphaeria sp. MPI-PUGE-AT-0046c]|nr:hypothetical protein DE146DRAFT_755339 [Phaeosphaeria sp. MPI-PUGE-AT-0046c]
MVLNLCIPRGEGQYKLIPKRPDPLGADVTLQYAIVGSTALAASYTSFASSYAQRVHPSQPVSRTALFIRSSARLGVWAGALGFAVNCYYYNALVGVIMKEQNLPVKPWKLYERSNAVTVDDGLLAGATLGLAASIPTIFMRRPAIPRWTRCVGMTNIGACAGVLGTYGYLQYNGERQKAYQRLERRQKRRSLEYWGICGDKELMSKFDPLIQLYIRQYAVWYTSHLAYDAYEQPAADDQRTTESTPTSAVVSTPQEEPAYYTRSYDYATYIGEIDLDSQHAEIQGLEEERRALLKEAEYLYILNAQRKYRYCHSGEIEEEERQRRLRELQLCEVVYNRLSTAVNVIDIKLTKLRLALQHKSLFDESVAKEERVEAWLPHQSSFDKVTHDPAMSIQEMEKFRAEIVADVTRFEKLLTSTGYSDGQRERWRKDIDDANVFLKAVDQVIWELEEAKKGVQNVKVKKGEEGMDAKGVVVNSETEENKETNKGSGDAKGGLEAEKP